MREYQQFPVSGKEGLRGTMFATSRFLDESEHRLLRLQDGREFLVPADAFQALDDGSYFLRLPLVELERYGRSGWGKDSGGQPATPASSEPAAPAAETASQVKADIAPRAENAGETVIPALEEEIQVGRRTVETGRVRVNKNVTETESVVDEPLLQDEFEVTRVPVNRLVEGTVETRQEGDTTIIPLLEEVLVVEKRLVLREEVHITRKRKEIHDPKHVTLRKENVEVERVKRARS